MLILHASKVMLKILQVRLHQEPRTSRCTNWVLKRQRNQRSNCQHSLHHEESKGFQKNIYFCFTDYAKAFDFVDHYKLWKILSFGNTRPRYLSLRNVYACQEWRVRIRHGTTDWLQIGKGEPQGYILLPWLFNSYTEYIMQNAELNESQAGIKISRRNISNLKYVNDVMLMVECEEELKSHLMRVKEKSEKLSESQYQKN